MAINTTLIKIRMAELGIDGYVELADKSKLTRDTVSNVINGKMNPSYETMNKLYYALELTPELGQKIFLLKNYRDTKVKEVTMEDKLRLFLDFRQQFTKREWSEMNQIIDAYINKKADDLQLTDFDIQQIDELLRDRIIH